MDVSSAAHAASATSPALFGVVVRPRDGSGDTREEGVNSSVTSLASSALSIYPVYTDAEFPPAPPPLHYIAKANHPTWQLLDWNITKKTHRASTMGGGEISFCEVELKRIAPLAGEAHEIPFVRIFFSAKNRRSPDPSVTLVFNKLDYEACLRFFQRREIDVYKRDLLMSDASRMGIFILRNVPAIIKIAVQLVVRRRFGSEDEFSDALDLVDCLEDTYVGPKAGECYIPAL